MYRKLQRNLTFICALGTGLVLVALAVLALAFSISRLRAQTEEAFQSKLNGIFYYLQAQSTFDQAWLSRMEADGDLWISLDAAGRSLRFTSQDARRERLTRLAAERAEEEYAYDPELRPATITPEVLRFAMKEGGVDYQAAVTSVPVGEDWINLVVLKDLSGEERTVWQMVLTYGGLSAGSLVLLVLFAYFFAGRAIRPVQESQEKQTAFVAAASHELRSPLAVLRLGLDRLEKNPDLSEDLIPKLKAEESRMSQLVEDMLFLARSDGDGWPFAPEDVSPQTIVLTAYERFEGLFQLRGIGFGLEIGDDLPPFVRCDEQRLQQLLSIFLDNALAYTPVGGQVRLSALLDGKNICLSVEDSGPGIPEEEREFIFDRFYRGDKARGHDGHHGLGLSIAREIGELHGGKVNVGESALGGARFTFQIPI